MTTPGQLWRVLTGLTAVALLTGCGGDGDQEAASTTTTAAEAPEVAAGAEDYCLAARLLDDQESLPTVEQLDELAAVAPEQIKADVEFVIGRFKAGVEAGDPVSAFGDPEVEQRLERVEEFEARVCGLTDDEEEQDPAVTALDPAARRIDVTATEYDFEFGEVAAGRTSFVMANAGQETHIMIVGKLKEGATLEQALAADDPEQFVEVDYESDIANAGEEAVVTADLTPGNWAMVCPIPASDGQPHFLKGMAVPFTVE